MGTFGVGLYEKGSTAHDEIETSERRGCWERIEEVRWSNSRGTRVLWTLKAAAGPCTRLTRSRGSLNPGGQTAALR